MPGQAPAVTDERELLVGYLVQQQDAFRNAMHGLTDEEAGRVAVPTSTLTVGTLAKHVTQTQRHWLDLVRAAAGDDVPEADPSEAGAAWQAAWTWTEADTVATATAELDAVSGDVLDAVRRVDLDVAVPVPPAPWNPSDVESWSVRWVWMHLVEELARHAGHADIVREAVDGATMYPLMAAREGWPETDWLKPWRRSA